MRSLITAGFVSFRHQMEIQNEQKKLLKTLLSPQIGKVELETTH